MFKYAAYKTDIVAGVHDSRRLCHEIANAFTTISSRINDPSYHLTASKLQRRLDKHLDTSSLARDGEMVPG